MGDLKKENVIVNKYKRVHFFQPLFPPGVNLFILPFIFSLLRHQHQLIKDFIFNFISSDTKEKVVLGSIKNRI